MRTVLFLLLFFSAVNLSAQQMVSASEDNVAEIFENSYSFNIYPNPAHDYFQISESKGVSSIEIYNIVGKKVSSFRNSENAIFDISQLKNGLYIVRLFNYEGSLLKSMRLSKR